MCLPIELLLSTLICSLAIESHTQRKTVAHANISQLTLVTFLHNAVCFQVCSEWCH
jgi:hypothetical protein